MTTEREKPIPSYRRHRRSGQAVVTLTDGLGGRRDIYLGPWKSQESKQEYLRIIGEWEANGRRLLGLAPMGDLSVNELLLAYWKHAEGYYGFKKGHRGDRYNLRDALAVVKELYGHTLAKDFGPLAFKAVRQRMIERGWSRTYINHQAGKIRRMFRWAAEEEMLPATIYQNLSVVRGLLAGRTTARETTPVKPVARAVVEATLPYLPPTVRTMVQLQLLTGARPTEICLMRPLDLDMRHAQCWVYRPGSDQGQHGAHKTAHHGHERQILIGPKAQELLRPYLGTKVDGYCFSPRASEQKRSMKRRQERITPLTPSQAARRPKRRRKRSLRDRYDQGSLRNAVYRACDRAFPPPVALAKRPGESRKEWQARLTEEERRQLADWQREHRWHPHRLRHTRALELKREAGLDVARAVLGHKSPIVTEHYATLDVAKAAEAMSRLG
jgi:integrase